MAMKISKWVLLSVSFKNVLPKAGLHSPGALWSCSTSLSLVVRSKCSAASATRETPAIAAFSHLLYAADETAAARNPKSTRPDQNFTKVALDHGMAYRKNLRLLFQ